MGNTVKIRRKYQVTIPESVRGEIPLKVGERVEIIALNGEIVIRPMVEVPRGQAWFWKDEWQQQIAESIKNLREGKAAVFKSVKEAKRLESKVGS